MLKKIVLASMLAASASVGLPTAAAADPNDECMLRNHCFWASGDGSNPGAWVCSDPAIYMLCLSPAGVTSAGLTFEPIKD